MATLDAETLAIENKPLTPRPLKKAAGLFSPPTFRLLLIVILVALALVLLPGFIRSNQLALPLLNNLQNPVRVAGFYPTENNGRDTFRWTTAEAKIYLPEVLAPQKIVLEVAAAYPEGAPRPRLHLRYNGQELANQLIESSWTKVVATFPAGLELATGSLELTVEDALAPRKGDNRQLGVAVRAAELEVNRVAPFGLGVATLVLGIGLLLAGRWVGFEVWRALFVSIGPMLLITLYYQFERFYSSILVGWLALLAGLATFIVLYPRAFFPPIQNKNSGGRWYVFNGGFWQLDINYLAQPYAKILAFVPALLVVAFVFVEYGRVLDFAFFWDDYHIARPWTLGEVAGTFVGPWDRLGLEPPYYRPLTVSSFALDWALSGFAPGGYHLTNLLLYSLAAGLLYFLLRKLALGWLAVLVGALFLVILPTNVAAATWISQRSDTLVAILMLVGLLGFVAFCRSSKIYWLVLANIALLLALCSKEIGAALPLLYVLYWWLFDGNKEWKGGFGRWRKSGIMFGPSFITLAYYVGWRALVLPASAPDLDPAKRVGLETLWNGYHSAVYQSFYGLNNWLTEQAAPWLTLTLVLAMALALLFGHRVKSNLWRVLFFGLGWLLISGAPLAFLGASYSVTARVLFLPEVGYAISVAALVALLGQFVGYSRGGWQFWPALALLLFLLVAPYAPLHTANQRAQKDYAPGSFNTLRWDEWVYNNPAWQLKIPEQHYKAIEQKLREAGRL